MTERFLKSPFNGERWPVPQELPQETYDAMVAGGFKPETAEQDDSQPRKRKEQPK